MEVVVRFAPSAFKHGVTKEDIYHVLSNVEYDDVLDDDNEKHLVLGFDSKANLLEILYNVIDEQTVKVFHAVYAYLSLFAQPIGGNDARLY